MRPNPTASFFLQSGVFVTGLLFLLLTGCVSKQASTALPVIHGVSATVRVESRCDGSRGPYGTSASVRREADALVFEFLCDDPDPWATHLRRDAPLYEEEVVEVFLAPGVASPTNYFEFEISPTGVLFDARVFNPCGLHACIEVDTAWNCPGAEWGAQIDADARRWTARLKLPLDSLGPDARSTQEWRLNLYRIERPRNGRPTELQCWSPTLTDPGSFHRAAQFGIWRMER
jgi:hypothetical protein